MVSNKFINPEIQMYYLVHMDHNGMAVQRALYPMKLMGVVMICFGMVMKRMRMLGV